MTVFQYLPPNVNVAVAVMLGVWCVFVAARATCSFVRVGMSITGAAFLFVAGFIYGVTTTLEGAFS